MNNWKDIKIKGIVNIRKCIAEFEIDELDKTPYGKLKIKIYEDAQGKMIGYTNLMVKDIDGCPFPAVGHGNCISETLENTIYSFLELLCEKEVYNDSDFECMDPYDF